MKKNLPLLLFFISILVAFQRCYKIHKGFCIDFIQNPIGNNRPLLDLNDDVLKLLDQPFKYLVSGNQCYVFESLDKQTVIKFISAKRFINNDLFLNSLISKKKTSCKKELNSYHLAYRYLKNESQILGLKLGSSINLKNLVLIDPFGITKNIDLNKAEFIIQPKALVLDKLITSKLIKSQDLTKVYDLIRFRLEHHIFDKDTRLHRNTGFYNQKPLFLDLGSFFLNDRASEEDKKKHLEKVIDYNHKHLIKRIVKLSHE
jgi:hypothetical protein